MLSFFVGVASFFKVVASNRQKTKNHMTMKKEIGLCAIALATSVLAMPMTAQEQTTEKSVELGEVTV